MESKKNNFLITFLFLFVMVSLSISGQWLMGGTLNTPNQQVIAPVIDFVGVPTTVMEGGCVVFTEISTGNPGSLSWSFEGGLPSTSTASNPSVVYNTAGTFDVSLTVTTSQGIYTETKTDYITVIPYDDIADALDCNLTFIKSGDADWFRVVNGGGYDNDYAQSGPITHSQSTSIETTFTVSSPSTVKFDWQVSSEPGYDFLKFYIDGTLKSQISGLTNWSQLTCNITSGTHTLKWTYIKDASVSIGSDCGIVDHLEIIGIDYCPSYSTDCSREWIARVRIGTLDNSSAASNYSDFTSIITNYTRGVSQSVILTPGFAGGAFTEYWKIFIDYNQDGDLTDAGENCFSKYGSSAVTGSFIPPTSAFKGNTRMRVTMRYGAYASSCGTFTYGEVEDYTANII